MEISLNKTEMIGRVASDLKRDETKNGKIKVKFRFATKRAFAGREFVDYHNIACYGKTVEVLEKCNVGKGDLLYLEGQGRIDSWKNDAGEWINWHEVHVLTLKPFRVGRVVESSEQENTNPGESIAAEDVPF